MQTLCQQLGIKRVTLTPYHLMANGSSESICKIVVDLLTMHVHQNKETWDSKIDFLVHHINDGPHSDTKQSSFYLFRGRDGLEPTDLRKRLRNRFLEDDEEADDEEAETFSFSSQWHESLDLARANLIIAKDAQTRQYNKNIRPIKFEIDDQVLVKEGKTQIGKFCFRFSTPRIIDERINDVNYLIRRPGDNHTQVVHVNRLVLWKAAKDLKKDDENLRPATQIVDATLPSVTPIEKLSDDVNSNDFPAPLEITENDKANDAARTERLDKQTKKAQKGKQSDQPLPDRQLRTSSQTAKLKERTGRSLRPIIKKTCSIFIN